MSFERKETTGGIPVSIKCLGMTNNESCKFQMDGEIPDSEGVGSIDLSGHTRRVLLTHHRASRKKGWMSGHDRYTFTSTEGGKHMSGDIYVTEGGFEFVQLTRFTIDGKDIFNFT
jgi:hypothetical protein